MRVRFSRFRLLLPAILLFSLVPHHHVLADALRLTRDIVPLFEEINLRIDPDQKEYTGSVRIDLKVTKATSRFRFHAVDLELGRLVLRNGDRALWEQYRQGPRATAFMEGM